MAALAPSDRKRIRLRVTGLRLPGELVKELKHLALDQDLTLREIMIRAAQEYVGKYRRKG
jgi:hypothetical protein